MVDASTALVKKGPQDLMEEARVKVVESEKEIKKIKTALLELQQKKGGSGDDKNTLKISVLEIKGLPKKENLSFYFQLSAPVEEKSCNKLYNAQNEDESVVLFTSVDNSIATMTIRVLENTELLGQSDAIDVSQWCTGTFDPFAKIQEIKSQKINVPILPEFETPSPSPSPLSDENIVVVNSSSSSPDHVVVEKEGPKDDIEEEDETSCSLLLQVEFHPSPGDVMDELNILLNQASKRKSAAIELLRKHARDVSGQRNAMGATGSNNAVKSGFLNKSKSGFLINMYEKTVGPNSLFRLMFPLVKNYVFFFGVVAFMHYKGEFLEIPNPV